MATNITISTGGSTKVVTVPQVQNNITISRVATASSSGGGGSSTFGGLTDTPGSFGSAGQVLAVNTDGDALVYVNGGGSTATLNDIGNVSTANRAVNSVIRWDGSSWVADARLTTLYTQFRSGTGATTLLADGLTASNGRIELAATTAKFKTGVSGIDVTESSPGELDFIVAAGSSGNETAFTAVELNGTAYSGTADFRVKNGTNFYITGASGSARLGHTGADVAILLPNTSGTLARTADIALDAAVVANTAKVGINETQAGNITDNNVKVTNATHTGEVLGATILTIANNIVDEARLKVSNDPTNGYVLSAQSGNVGGLTWAAPGTSAADASISEAKLNVSNAPTDGYVLTAQSGDTGGLTWAAPGTPSITDDSITTDKIADYAVTEDKLSSTLLDEIDANTAKATFPGFGTTSGTALAGNTALLQLGTSSTTALAGDTALLQLGTSATTALAGDTALLQLGTSSTTALAGDTALLQLGASSTTALAGNTALLQLGTSSTTALAGDTTTISSDQATAITANATTAGNAMPKAGGTFTGAIDMGSNNITTTGQILFSNVYSELTDLPAAGTYHGMFAHVHDTGAAYFAHGGNWIQLAKNSDVLGTAAVSNGVATLATGDQIHTFVTTQTDAIAANTTGTAANVTGTVVIGKGGTGATTAAGARTALGLGTAATSNVGDFLAANGTAATVTTNADLTGNVTSIGNATTIADAAVTMAMLADIATDTFIGRTADDGGVPKALTKTEALGILNVENGATADQTATEIRALVGTGNDGVIPVTGAVGHFLRHDGTFGLPSYIANTDTQNTTTLSFVDSSNDAILRNTTGGAGSGYQDVKFVAGSNVTLTPDTSSDPQTLTIAATTGGIANVLADTGPQLGGDLDTNSKNILFAKPSNTDYSSNGDIVKFGGATGMTEGDLYYLNSSGTWAPANATSASTSGACLLAIALGEISDTHGMLLRGFYTMNDAAIEGTEATGDELYVGENNGHVTSAPPSSENDVVRVIGYCIDGTNGQIWFNPSNDFIVLAAS